MALGERVGNIDVHDSIGDETTAWLNDGGSDFEMTEHYEERAKHSAMT